MLNNRKGQVVIFMIIAIIILTLGFMYFMFFYEKKLPSPTPEGKEFDVFMDHCIRNAIIDTVVRVGQQSGYYNVTVPYLMFENNKIPTANVILLVSRVNSEIVSGIEDKIRNDCLNKTILLKQFKKYYEIFDIDPSCFTNNINVEMYNKSVVVFVECPVEYGFKNNLRSTKTFSVLYDFDIEKIIELYNKIVMNYNFYTDELKNILSKILINYTVERFKNNPLNPDICNDYWESELVDSYFSEAFKDIDIFLWYTYPKESEYDLDLLRYINLDELDDFSDYLVDFFYAENWNELKDFDPTKKNLPRSLLYYDSEIPLVVKIKDIKSSYVFQFFLPVNINQLDEEKIKENYLQQLNIEEVSGQCENTFDDKININVLYGENPIDSADISFRCYYNYQGNNYYFSCPLGKVNKTNPVLETKIPICVDGGGKITASKDISMDMEDFNTSISEYTLNLPYLYNYSFEVKLYPYNSFPEDASAIIFAVSSDPFDLEYSLFSSNVIANRILCTTDKMQLARIPYYITVIYQKPDGQMISYPQPLVWSNNCHSGRITFYAIENQDDFDNETLIPNCS